MSTTTKLTLDQYDRMIAAGRFEPRERNHLELIEAELRDMGPIGARHEVLVDNLTEWSVMGLGDRARVRIQNSIGILELESAPQPDVAWVIERRYASRPEASDAFLIIEVADTSVDFDRGRKADLYAMGGIPDYWIVNIPERSVEVHRQPENGRYRSVQNIVGGGGEIRSIAFPDVVLNVDELFAMLPL